MNRKLLSLALIVLLVSVASATRVRVLTLGEVNHIVKDKANIELYPQAINNYPIFASMEIDGANLYSIGGHYKVRDAVYAMYLTTEGIPEGGMYGPQVKENGATDVNTAPKLNLYYGRKLGDIPFGMNLNIYQNSWKSKVAGDKTERSQTYMGVGFGATFIEKLDVGLNIRTHSFTDKDAAGDDASKPNGGFLMDLNARYWWQVEDHSYVIPYFMFSSENQGVDQTGVGKASDKTTSIALGAGFNTWITESTLFVADFGIQTSSTENKVEPTGGPSTTTKISENTLPYYSFGFETPVTNWLTARIGAVRNWETYSEDNNKEWGSSTTSLYLGAGMRKGDFMLDLNVDPGVINRGPYFLTGASSTGWSTMASLRYMPTK